MAVEIIEVVAVAGAIGVADLDRQKQPAAHGVMRHQNVHHRDDGDQHRRRQIGNVPPGIVHGRSTPSGLAASVVLSVTEGIQASDVTRT